jgi:hypothetical protein
VTPRTRCSSPRPTACRRRVAGRRTRRLAAPRGQGRVARQDLRPRRAPAERQERVIEIRELFGMVELGEKFLHTAHEVKTARKAFKRLKHFFGDKANDPNAKFPELNALVVEIRSTNGQEAILLHAIVLEQRRLDRVRRVRGPVQGLRPRLHRRRPGPRRGPGPHRRRARGTAADHLLPRSATLRSSTPAPRPTPRRTRPARSSPASATTRDSTASSRGPTSGSRTVRSTRSTSTTSTCCTPQPRA